MRLIRTLARNSQSIHGIAFNAATALGTLLFFSATVRSLGDSGLGEFLPLWSISTVLTLGLFMSGELVLPGRMIGLSARQTSGVVADAFRWQIAATALSLVALPIAASIIGETSWTVVALFELWLLLSSAVFFQRATLLGRRRFWLITARSLTFLIVMAAGVGYVQLATGNDKLGIHLVVLNVATGVQLLIRGRRDEPGTADTDGAATSHPSTEASPLNVRVRSRTESVRTSLTHNSFATTLQIIMSAGAAFIFSLLSVEPSTIASYAMIATLVSGPSIILAGVNLRVLVEFSEASNRQDGDSAVSAYIRANRDYILIGLGIFMTVLIFGPLGVGILAGNDLIPTRGLTAIAAITVLLSQFISIPKVFLNSVGLSAHSTRLVVSGILTYLLVIVLTYRIGFVAHPLAVGASSALTSSLGVFELVRWKRNLP